MGGKDSNYQVVYRGEMLDHFVEGGWVFFQRQKQYGGGYWFGRTYTECFLFCIERPVALREGFEYMQAFNSIAPHCNSFDDDFDLTPPPSEP